MTRSKPVRTAVGRPTPGPQRRRRVDVVDHAIALLDDGGLERWSMRRLAADLGVRPSALYHHFPSKDALLAAVADELLRRGRRPTEIVTWESELRLVCVELRDAMRSHPGAAAVIADAHARGHGAFEPRRRMQDALLRAGADEGLGRVGARTLLHYTLAHHADPDSEFALGLAVVLDGLAVQLGVR